MYRAAYNKEAYQQNMMTTYMDIVNLTVTSAEIEKGK